MKTLIMTLLIATATAFSQEQQPAQPQPDRKQGEARRATMKKLQADLDQAASRAKFTDEQRKQWEEARQTLRQQGQRGARRNRVAPDTASNTGSAREAMKTLRSLTASEAFQPEDRDLLKKDFDALRKSGGRNRHGAKTRKSAA
jgi:hypothetical protein